MLPKNGCPKEVSGELNICLYFKEASLLILCSGPGSLQFFVDLLPPLLCILIPQRLQNSIHPGTLSTTTLTVRDLFPSHAPQPCKYPVVFGPAIASFHTALQPLHNPTDLNSYVS